MKRNIVPVVLALALAVGGAEAQDRLTEQERRELQTQADALRQQLRELERRMGRDVRTIEIRPSFVGAGRARIGVVLRDGRDATTDSIGAVIEAVTPSGPADQAGLAVGDIIVTINGERVVVPARGTAGAGIPAQRVQRAMAEVKDGDTVVVEYRRGRDSRRARIVARALGDESFVFTMPRLDTVVARAMPRIDTALMRAGETMERVRFFGEPGAVTFAWGSARWSDMEIVSLNPELGRYFGSEEGILVVRAPRDTLLGLRGGDVIRSINGRAPTSPSHAVRILRSFEPGEEIRIDLLRERRRQTVRATVPER